MNISKNLVKLSIKTTIAVLLVSFMSGLFLIFNLYESRTPLEVLFQLDIFSIITNSSGTGSLAIQGIALEELVLEESEFSSVMVYARVFGLLAFTSVLSAVVFSAIEVFDIDQAGTDEKPRSFIGLMREKLFLALQFSVPVGLVYFLVTLGLGMLDDSIYYPICYLVKVPLMAILVTGVANIATEESEERPSIENIKSALEDSLELMQVNLVPMIIQAVVVTGLMFIPVANIVVGFIWCILAPIIDTALYYKTFLAD